MRREAREWQNLEPGRCEQFRLPLPCTFPYLSLSVCVLDAPSHFETRSAFAAILVPRGQELDWVFCVPSGLWDLLFSAYVSRLVVLRRLIHQREEEEDEDQHLCAHPDFQANLGGESLTDNSQSDHVCVHDIDAATRNSEEEEEEEEEHEHQQARGKPGDLCVHPHFLHSKQDYTEQEDHQHPHRSRAQAVSGISQSCCLHSDLVDVDGGVGDDVSFKRSTALVLRSLFPWSICPHGPAPDPYVTYEDHVRTRVVVEIRNLKSVGGGILVEDVELNCSSDDDTSNAGMGSNMCRRTLRRRMRFQHMPNLIQTEVPIAIYENGQLTSMHGLEDVKAAHEKTAGNDSLAKGSTTERGKVGEVSEVELEVRPDHTKLVHKYLPAMVAGLVLASPCLEACRAANTMARVCAIGLGGGALPIFLHRQFGFHVVAVDTDETVVDLARSHFGLVENEHLRVQVKDGMDVVFGIARQACKSNFVSLEMAKDWKAPHKDSAHELCQGNLRSGSEANDTRMHVIAVDVNVIDACLGLLSPPSCFLSKSFLLAARMALHEGGMLVLNVIPRAKDSFNEVVSSLRRVFSGIYQIKVEDNHVVFAFPSKIPDINMSCVFALNVALAIGEDLFDKIEEIE